MTLSDEVIKRIISCAKTLRNDIYLANKCKNAKNWCIVIFLSRMNFMIS